MTINSQPVDIIGVLIVVLLVVVIIYVARRA